MEDPKKNVNSGTYWKNGIGDDIWEEWDPDRKAENNRMKIGKLLVQIFLSCGWCLWDQTEKRGMDSGLKISEL